MGFLSPWFLAGLAGLGLPIYLHLLKRQTQIPKPFASLMFWEARTQASTKHRRLDHLLLLALRLLMLLFLILAFANPFINRSAAEMAANRLVLIVVDNSLSMRAGTRLDDAKTAALGVLGSKGAARGQVASFGSQLHLLTQPIQEESALRAAVQSIQPGDAHGSLGELARAMRSMSESVHTPIELHVFSDFQRSDLAANFSDLSLPSNVKLVAHAVVTKVQPNWTVESVDAPGQVWGKDAKPVRVQAVIAGYNTSAAQKSVSLVVNDKALATKQISVPANGKATVEFASLEVPYGLNKCEVRIDSGAASGDAMAADDVRRFAVERSDPEKILLVHNYGDNRSPVYITAALSAAAQAAFVVEPINVNEAADRKISTYGVVILSDLTTVPALLENTLTGYVKSGGAVFIAAGTSAASHTQIPIFDAHISETHDYTRNPDHYALVGDIDSSFGAVGKADSWHGVKFYYALSVDPAGARVIARLSDQTPVLMEKRIGEGRVVLFSSGLDNLANDFPLHPAFVPFIEQTTRYLAGSERQGGALPVDAFLELRNARQQGQAVEVTDPQGKQPLSLSEAAKAQSIQLTEAGYYQLRLADGHQNLVGVNADPKESNLDVIPDDVMSLWTGKNGQAADETQASTGPAKPHEIPQSFWWYVMLFLLLSAVAESVLASHYLGVQREDS